MRSMRWNMVYACRYGKQRLSEVESWTLPDLAWFVETLDAMMRAESESESEKPDEEGPT